MGRMDGGEKHDEARHLAAPGLFPGKGIYVESAERSGQPAPRDDDAPTKAGASPF
jgi:hypothetical protein